jgi:hypothetical protein
MDSKLKKISVVIIGCGIFGSEIALALSNSGFSVSIIEVNDEILRGASGNNLNRIHIGFHYPRDLETAKQAFQCYEEFRNKYSACVDSSFVNSYLIANRGSLTSPERFFQFCNELGAPHKVIESTELPLQISGANSGILCDESVYDFGAMRKLILENFTEQGVNLKAGIGVKNLIRLDDGYSIELSNGDIIEADVVINASYASINRFSSQVGIELREMQYEYTVIPIIKAEIPRVGITIMDGPFTSILPRGSSNEFLLYHVDHSVLSAEIGYQLNRDWLFPAKAPFFQVNKQEYFSKMIKLCGEFIPSLKSAKLSGFLEGPRIVQSRKESSDARPSLLNFGNCDSYVSILSGKVDSSIWVSKIIQSRLLEKFL